MHAYQGPDVSGELAGSDGQAELLEGKMWWAVEGTTHEELFLSRIIGSIWAIHCMWLWISLYTGETETKNLIVSEIIYNVWVGT